MVRLVEYLCPTWSHGKMNWLLGAVVMAGCYPDGKPCESSFYPLLFAAVVMLPAAPGHESPLLFGSVCFCVGLVHSPGSPLSGPGLFPRKDDGCTLFRAFV